MEIMGGRDLVKNHYNQMASTELSHKLTSSQNFETLINHLYEQTTKSVKKHLGKYLEGKALRVSAVADALRNVYAHGRLSTSPKGHDTTALIFVCNAISDHLLAYMDNEFSKKIDAAPV